MTFVFLKRYNDEVMMVGVNHVSKIITLPDNFTKKQIVQSVRILKMRYLGYNIR